MPMCVFSFKFPHKTCAAGSGPVTFLVNVHTKWLLWAWGPVVSCKFPQNGSCDMSRWLWAAQVHMCALLCALICVLSYVCSHNRALPVLSYVLSYVCSHMCALLCLLSYVCSPMCALLCALICVLLLCSHAIKSIPSLQSCQRCHHLSARSAKTARSQIKKILQESVDCGKKTFLQLKSLFLWVAPWKEGSQC